MSICSSLFAKDGTKQRKMGEHTICSKEISACSPMFDFSFNVSGKDAFTVYINLSVHICAIQPGHFGFKINMIIYNDG